MTEITKNQRIAILVYKEDHPEAYPPEISEATSIPYRDVVYVLREYEANRPRYQVKIDTEFSSYEEAMSLVEAIKAGGDKAEVVDVTPCAFRVFHGPGSQSEAYCEIKGPHKIHGVNIMGRWEEFDQDGENIW